MTFKTMVAILALSGVLGTTAVLADARDDLAKEVRDEIATRQMSCTVDYLEANACGGNGILDTCVDTMDALTDFKSEIEYPETQRRAVYRWWLFVSSNQGRSNCMRALLSHPTYCKAVNLVAKFDPHKNCSSSGGTNATCWINREWKRDPLLLPREESEWSQRCEVEKPAGGDPAATAP